MPDVTPPELQVRIVAAVPLLRLGLERIASEAGFSLLNGDTAPIVLRSVDAPPSNADVDIADGPGAVTLTLRHVPEPAAWAALRDLLDRLLESPDRVV